ncbi:hypothetical protein RFM99_20390 [Mesorhizobium sp. VK4C]|nr:hypothetical protein [Mesorhizobium sp. VK4C]MDX8500763.1 hypothetical protein [Mesorhizobium sp. VK4C]
MRQLGNIFARYTVFGEAVAKSSLKESGDSRAIGAKLGFSMKC